MHLGSADRQIGEKLRVNPRKSWYRNVDSVTTDGDLEVTFHLKRPQPAFIGLLASGWSPVYPCHVPPAQMRQHPIGTGPFKFVEFKPNESIMLARNPDYWKPGLPYLDGIEYSIIRNHLDRVLALGVGQFDRTWPGFVPLPLMREIKGQAPRSNAGSSVGTSRSLIINRERPPFDNPELRKAIGLASTARRSSTSSARARAISAHDAAAARRRLGHPAGAVTDAFRATARMSRRTATRRARSWESSAMGRTIAWRSRDDPQCAAYRDPAVW